MSKYIDAEKLIVVLERQNTDKKVIQPLIRITDSLQQEQPEVKLNEEIIINEFHAIRDKCFNEGIEGFQREKLIARHFYELGLNARKKE